MRKTEKKKCRHCRRLFVPDHRNRKKQNYCQKGPCRKTSKKASQKKWLSKPENEDYFSNPDNVRIYNRKMTPFYNPILTHPD